MKSLKEHMYEGLLQGEEATLIDGDDFVKKPEIALNAKCKDINEVADIISKCIGQKIKVKKMSGKWYTLGSDFGPNIDVKGCPGFVIEYTDASHMNNRVDRKLYFAVWEGRLVCRYDLFYYRRKKGVLTVWTSADIANPKNYTKVKNSLGTIGTATRQFDDTYKWGEDTLWDWLENSGYDRFFNNI